VGLWVYHVVQGVIETASEFSGELFKLAAKLRSGEFRLLAELVACDTCWVSGQYTSVLSHAARALALYDPERHRGPAIFMTDPAIQVVAVESLALWYLGYPERASERGLVALSMGQAVALSVQSGLGSLGRGHPQDPAEGTRANGRADESVSGDREGAGISV
jgi:predicted ATPase